MGYALFGLSTAKVGLAAGDGSDDEEGFPTRDYVGGEGCVRRVVGKVLLAGEEADEGAAFAGDVVAESAAEDWIAGFEGVEDRADGDGRRNVELEFTGHLRQYAQVGREQDPDHDRVCTSTERTGGRSRTMAVQLSPSSAEA